MTEEYKEYEICVEETNAFIDKTVSKKVFVKGCSVEEVKDMLDYAIERNQNVGKK